MDRGLFADITFLGLSNPIFLVLFRAVVIYQYWYGL